MKRVLVFLLLLAMAGIASADIMPDGGFEAGMWSGSGGFVYMAYPSSYTWGYASPYQGTAAPQAGTYSGVFVLPSSGPAYSWSYASVGVKSFAGGNGWSAAWQQGLVASEGDVLQASSYIKQLSGPAGGGGIMKIEWIDDTGGEISEDVEFFSATSDWTQITGSLFTAPAGTVGATMVVGNETYMGGLIGTAIAFDSVTLDIIPEPMSIALLGLGGLFLRRRKA